MNLSPLLHQSAQNCSCFSLSRQKLRRQHVGKRENMAIIIPGMPVKKSLIEMKLLSWHILPHLFIKKCKKMWGDSAQGCWEAQDRDTKAAWTSPSQDPPGSSYLKKDDLNFLWDCVVAVLCWADNNLGLLHLWISLLSLFTHGHWWEWFCVYTGQPSRNTAGKKPPDFYHSFALYRAEMAEVKKKKTSHKEDKMLFPKLFRWQMFCCLCSAIESQL